MKINIKKSKPQGTIASPPSKSMAHRLLICSGLCKGTSIVHGIAPSEDVLATLDCLSSLGATYTYEGDTVTINGIKEADIASQIFQCRESGSTLRFFLPLCMNGTGEAELYGSEILLSRPLDVYKDICAEQNINFTNDGKKITVSGKLSSGDYVIKGNISSQFITGLLFALPRLDGNSKITIIPPIESLSYINMTIDALKEFGVVITWLDSTTLYIQGNQEFSEREVWVEGDYSNSAFFAAMNSLGGDVSITGLKKDSLQGDKVYETLFKQLENDNAVIDISDCPDLGPVLFAVAAAKKGGTFTGTKRLKIKESDRATAMAEELNKFGVKVDILENTVIITRNTFHKPDAVLCAHNDHRIVMSLCVLLLLTGGCIDGAEAVNKSMPDFFEKLQQLGVDINYETI